MFESPLFLFGHCCACRSIAFWLSVSVSDQPNLLFLSLFMMAHALETVLHDVQKMNVHSIMYRTPDAYCLRTLSMLFFLHMSL